MGTGPFLPSVGLFLSAQIEGGGGALKPLSDLDLFRLVLVQLLVQKEKRARTIG